MVYGIQKYLQDVVKDELLEYLNLEFVNRVNEVGVDVNRCITHAHTASLIQFVCGLGPRKGYHLLKVRLTFSHCLLSNMLHCNISVNCIRD